MKKTLCSLFFVFVLLVPEQAMGCTIPVFRYALENWSLTPYEIMVFHHGPLPVDVQKTLAHWHRTPSKANIDITIIEVNDKTAPNLSNSLHNVWKREGDSGQRPWMVVRSLAEGAKSFAWSGPCTPANLLGVIDSPARQAILAHLKVGVSGVFVFLASGDPQADKIAHEMAVRELALLEKKIKLPAQSDDGPQLKLPLPLIVSFPIIVVDRTRPEEAAFVKLLLATEDGLDKVKGPILFPLFGRGRVLGSVSGEEVNAEQIQQVAKFLCRECSCQLKELNPGVDMLVAAEWSALFDKLFDKKEGAPHGKEIGFRESAPIDDEKASEVLAMPEPVKSSAPAPAEQTPIQPVPSETIAKETPSQCILCENWLWIATGFAAILVLVTGGWAFFSWRR